MLSESDHELPDFTLFIELIYEELKKPDRQFDAINSWLNAAVIYWNKGAKEVDPPQKKEL